MRALLVMVLSLLVVVGCAAPSTQAVADAAAPPPQPTSQRQGPVPGATPEKPRVGQPIKMPPTSDPLPPERVQVPSGTPVRVDRTCKVDSDCVVKDVGSCCGRMPACVHRNSPTDPAGVQAECARKGISSICGFNEITACRCVRNQCLGEQEPVGGWMDDPPAPPPAER